MTQSVRITSKRQITIPVKIYNKLHLNKGDRLIVRFTPDKLILQKAQVLLDSLAGSLKVPEKYKNKSTDEIVSQAKQDYFQHKK